MAIVMIVGFKCYPFINQHWINPVPILMEALKSEEEVTYRRQKSRKTTNALYLTDRQWIPLAISNPVAENHHDLYKIKDSLSVLFTTLTGANIKLDGLFINANAGFDSKEFRETCFKHGIFANVDFKYREWKN